MSSRLYGECINTSFLIKHTFDHSKLTLRQTEKYVQQEAALFEAECRQGLVLDGNIKLKNFIENEWLPHKKRELKNRTYKRYKEMLPRIYAVLGHLRLDRIRPQHLMSFYEQLAESGVRLDTKYRCNIDIAAYHKKHGLSRAELSRKTNIAATTLAALEQGKNCNEENAKKFPLPFINLLTTCLHLKNPKPHFPLKQSCITIACSRLYSQTRLFGGTYRKTHVAVLDLHV